MLETIILAIATGGGALAGSAADALTFAIGGGAPADSAVEAPERVPTDRNEARVSQDQTAPRAALEAAPEAPPEALGAFDVPAATSATLLGPLLGSRQAVRQRPREPRAEVEGGVQNSSNTQGGGQLAVPGVFTNQGTAGSTSVLWSPYYFTVKIPGGSQGTGTGYKEEFMVSVPSQDQPRPLLVVFHKFSTSQLDAFVNTQFFQQASQRGWHIVAPLSASGVNFGSPPSQINTEAALDWMLANFNIRADRIYGVGFSMGGGTALSYAATHLDPSKPMFAAIVNHSGGIALNDTYINEPASQFIFDFWFGTGAPGSANVWKMAAASMFEFNPGTLVVDPTSDMGRNLQHMPVKIFHVSNDPLEYLTVQSDVLATYLINQGTQTQVEIPIGFSHEWGNLSEFKTINWLSKKQLTLPLSGRILADRSATFFYFELQQIVVEAFSYLDWDVDLLGNTLTVTSAANLATVQVETLETGLDPLSTLRVQMDTADGSPVIYSLRDWITAPTTVTRDLVVTTAFVHDPVAKTLTLLESDGGNHVWEITP